MDDLPLPQEPVTPTTTPLDLPVLRSKRAEARRRTNGPLSSLSSSADEMGRSGVPGCAESLIADKGLNYTPFGMGMDRFAIGHVIQGAAPKQW